ncbi:MAG: hypothetical protein ACI8RZ_001982 [Myxococcota bacterium]|jgi:hypothetical protein
MTTASPPTEAAVALTTPGETRVERRMWLGAVSDIEGRFEPHQRRQESSRRGRIARKVRYHLRRMEPVVVLSPRWSQPLSFLEDLALDLAVGEPAIGCRTVRFRALKGRRLPEIWNHLVEVFQRFIPTNTSQSEAPSSVVDRRGFRWSMETLLEQAHTQSPHRVALLACEAEHLPLSVLEDLTLTWGAYYDSHPEDRRCTILLAGSVQAQWLNIGTAPRVELADYSEDEAVAAMMARTGERRPNDIRSIARFTGGIPGIVDRVSAHFAEHGSLPASRDELIHILGTLGDEMRGAVDIIAADSGLSERLDRLMRGEALPEARLLDEPLRMAGLLRIVPTHGLPHVTLRAPAIAALLG